MKLYISASWHREIFMMDECGEFWYVINEYETNDEWHYHVRAAGTSSYFCEALWHNRYNGHVTCGTCVTHIFVTTCTCIFYAQNSENQKQRPLKCFKMVQKRKPVSVHPQYVWVVNLFLCVCVHFWICCRFPVALNPSTVGGKANRNPFPLFLVWFGLVWRYQPPTVEHTHTPLCSLADFSSRLWWLTL